MPTKQISKNKTRNKKIVSKSKKKNRLNSKSKKKVKSNNTHTKQKKSTLSITKLPYNPISPIIPHEPQILTPTPLGSGILVIKPPPHNTENREKSKMKKLRFKDKNEYFIISPRKSRRGN
jgi:hypothetical protein